MEPSGPVQARAVRRSHDSVLTVVGQLDLATAPRPRQVLLRLESSARALGLDLRHLDFVDSGGWRTIEQAVARRHDLGLRALTVVTRRPDTRSAPRTA